MRRVLCLLVFMICQNLSAETVRFTVLHWSDGESSLENFADFAAVTEDLKRKHPKNLLISAGDNYLPGPYFMAGGFGKSDISLINQLKPIVSAVGNHEFDYGNDVFSSALKTATFPYLAANINASSDPYLKKYFKTEMSTSLDESSGKISPSLLIKKYGLNIGFIGIVTPEIVHISSPGKYLKVQDKLAEIVNRRSSELRKSGADLVILIAHLQGVANEINLTTSLKGVDLVIAGGGNDLLANSDNRLWSGDIAKGPYPTLVVSADSKQIPVVATDGDYKYIGVLPLVFDLKTKTLSVEAGAGPVPTNEAYVKSMGLKRSKEIIEETNRLNGIILSKGKNIIGKSEFFLNGIRHDVRNRQTNLGSAAADSMLWYARKKFPDIALAWKNSGSIRSSIGDIDQMSGERKAPQSGISQLDIESALRFNDELVVLELSAEELKQALENASSRAYKTSGGFPQLAGVNVIFNSRKTAQKRAVNKEKKEVSIKVKGERVEEIKLDSPKPIYILKKSKFRVDKKKKYKIITSRFVAKGGDDFPVFKNAKLIHSFGSMKGERKAGFNDSGYEQYTFASYLKALKIIPHKDENKRFVDSAYFK